MSVVGFVGLGRMGGAMAAHLVDAGHRVLGFDPSPEARTAGEASGVTMGGSLTDLNVPLVMSSLPGDAEVEEVYLAGLFGALEPGALCIDLSTIGVGTTRKIASAAAEAGHRFLDCPVSGTGAQAKTKDLVIYASGDSRAIRRLRPLFAGFARAAHDLGAFGNGSRMKFVANLLVAINNVASAEAMVLGLKAGLDAKTVLEMVRSGAGNSRVFELREGVREKCPLTPTLSPGGEGACRREWRRLASPLPSGRGTG